MNITSIITIVVIIVGIVLHIIIKLKMMELKENELKNNDRELCTNCGNQIKSGNEFCVKCGKKIKKKKIKVQTLETIRIIIILIIVVIGCIYLLKIMGFYELLNSIFNKNDVKTNVENSLNVKDVENKNNNIELKNNKEKSEDVYSLIKYGMNYYDVYAILGKPDSDTGVDRISRTCVWFLANDDYITVLFINGTVYEKLYNSQPIP